MEDADAERDNAFIVLARAGDTRAFGEIVRRHQDRVFSFILRLTGTRDEAMDLTQEVFMKAWQALPEWRPEARFSTWLLQIARNLSIDMLRRRQAVQFAPLDDELDIADAAMGPEACYAARQHDAQLARALQRIPTEHREILLLREVEDLTYSDIAQTLGIRPGTVKSRLARARAALLERLGCKTGEDRG
ncbi:RNA polymerase sigma factor [Aromatoleum aromaticum]|uniref:RNA polymerase sigma factor (Sigma24) n=1 Tax=Aromatoleum aromaticum (strain DSM 19018 / LMG 30748 / EbN1) TaxID=76114 RepID=Q5P1X9_AROAE|nr:sigma-70 family RNA polymerase sigma factor [Aromatoleum aromaticum]NMG56096.1 sigma-70 family RNA polymerase sigma factor [Aromatoleum aromaticum]CAI08685.1 RNA polymerase sigma factor (sigma24) [Aromatoleum aromaticum EbN1]